MIDAPPRLDVLGTGSSGNAAILHLPTPDGERHLIIDLGLGPRTLRQRCRNGGIDFDANRVAGVLLTHDDGDHLRPSWVRTLEREGWPLYAIPSHHPAIARVGVPGNLLRPVAEGRRRTVIDRIATISAAIAPHDDHGTAVYRLDLAIGSERVSMGWATDLGRLTPEVESLLRGCDVIAIESNYDEALQNASPRPEFLKRRIMGGHGHLSNREALEGIRRLARDRMPTAVVLLHGSRECNAIEIVDALWRREAPDLHPILTIGRHDRPVGSIPIRRSGADRTQPMLFA